jgi:hypothetical protein
MLTLWNDGRKGRNYGFIDRHISNHMRMSGTAIYVHMYQGVPDEDGSVTSLTKIQDVTFLENRDRKYSKDIQVLTGCYNVQDIDFDLRQFGIFLANDTLFIEFHINDMLAMLGRKIIAGDVLELPHMRDDMQLDPEARAVNRYYVVQDASKGASGFSATWHAHIWRVKAAPMTGAQEYADILDQQALDPFGFGQGMTLRDIITTEGKDAKINKAVIEEAVENVSRRYFETRQFYYVPGSDTSDPWIFAGDGVPPNGAELLGSGDVFPARPSQGDYYLRTDYQPATLYQFENGKWLGVEIDHRTSHWSAANRVLESFFNNTATMTLDDGTVISQKVSLSKAIKYKPEADF